jgi:MFS family permease
MRQRLDFLFLNVGHFYDHFFILIFATAAALALTRDWGLTYAELIPYATPGFIAFGLATLPAGWLADKWSRPGMMAIFFLGIGVSSALTALADSPLAIAVGLTAIGLFAAIYHPVGIALVVEGRARTGMALAVNGVFGNLGVASAALVTGLFIDVAGWRAAFLVPGAVAMVTGIAYVAFIVAGRDADAGIAKPATPATAPVGRDALARIVAVTLVSTAIGGLIFQASTFALPKVLDERLADLAASATAIGLYAFIVFAVASVAQLVVGTLIDRGSARTIFVVIAAAQAVLFWAMQGSAGIAALLVATGFMLAVFGQIPINDVLIGRIATGTWRSRLFAVRYVITFAVSATAVPLIAWIHGQWGFDRLFLVLAIAAAAILGVVLLLPAKAAVLRGAPKPRPAE